MHFPSLGTNCCILFKLTKLLLPYHSTGKKYNRYIKIYIHEIWRCNGYEIFERNFEEKKNQEYFGKKGVKVQEIKK